jgi:hypothetical protein
MPRLNEAKFIAITDMAAGSSALTTGEVDYINCVDMKTLGKLQRNPKI